VLGIGFLILIEPSWITGMGAAITVSQNGEFAYAGELEKGRDFIQRRQYEQALKAFKRANEMQEKKCAECLFWMAQAYKELGAYRNVVESCEKAIELAASDTKLQAQLYNLQGVGFQLLSEGKDQKTLQQAEAALRRGLALDFAQPSLRYNLGIVLLQQQRDAEGIPELNKYLEAQPDDVNADLARKIIANPRRAREPYAPEFSIITSEREYIALEDLLGKVVLLDFWGTWCPPCVASVPSLRSLAKRHAKERAFVMIGISSDTDEVKWRGFIAKNQMVWPQYLDRDRRISRAFGVRVFPSYILIDHEGILRFRGSGASFERSADLENSLQKLLKLAAQATAQ
jgi:tetratricopeptide (TPR) repeat protein